MEVLVRPDPQQASRLAAKVIARLVAEKPDCVLGLATGRTPLLLYQELVRLHREDRVDFSRVTTFNLDEYAGLATGHPQSYRHFMDRELFSQINIRRENTHLPDGTAADLRQECRDYEKRIRNSGGIDLQVLGLGSNGHIGFNEPTGSLASRTWVKILSQQTIGDNSELFNNPSEVPRHCITMGIGTIMEARHCLLLAFGPRKARAVAAMIEGPVTAMCPASALQFHPRITAVVDEAAAGGLSLLEHYRWIEKHKLSWQQYA
jgi:glucosamine-6-phosphate deaminase